MYGAIEIGIDLFHLYVQYTYGISFVRIQYIIFLLRARFEFNTLCFRYE